MTVAGGYSNLRFAYENFGRRMGPSYNVGSRSPPARLLYLVLTISTAMTSFADRPIKKLVLFDVDGTLTPARQVRSFRLWSSKEV